MKKLIILIVLFPSLAFAFSIQEMHRKVIAAKNAVSLHVRHIMLLQFFHDGDHATSDMTACDSSGDPVTFTLTNATIVNRSSHERTSNVLHIDDAAEYMGITNITANSITSLNEAQTICIMVRRE